MGELGVAAAQLLYLFAPLLVAVVFTGLTLKRYWLRALARPIDGGATFRGRRVFGDSKTWRIVVVAVVVCMAGVTVQKHIVGARAGWVALVDYVRANPLLLGAALGVGATAGELPNSFLKRQLGIAPGKTTSGAAGAVFWVLDQVDLLVLTWPLLLFWIRPPGAVVALSFVMALVLHPLVAAIGYVTGMRKTLR